MGTESRALDKKGVVDVKGIADKVLPLPELSLNQHPLKIGHCQMPGRVPHTKFIANNLDSAKPLAKQRFRLGLVGGDMVDIWLIAQDGSHTGGVEEVLKAALIEMVRTLAISDVEH